MTKEQLVMSSSSDGTCVESTIKLITHEVRFSDKTLTARCDRMDLMSHGLLITQLPMEVEEETDKTLCVFISYREISKMQLSKSPNLDSCYMFITVSSRTAKYLFDKLLGFGTLQSCKSSGSIPL